MSSEVAITLESPRFYLVIVLMQLFSNEFCHQAFDDRAERIPTVV